ncbi:hypothetical protein [Candidatus Aalborgicola defluviihabitans]|uniref:hypothetical protein n=1 Tax=Candidatus Aalborgicola defluviihabitans TaxID=3386187 RepID=UPI00390AA955|nr:hypothetical protein [Burkholderiales bacterium]
MNTSSSPLRPLPHIGFGVVHHARTRPSAPLPAAPVSSCCRCIWSKQWTRGAAAAECSPTGPARELFDEDHGEGRSAAQGGAMPLAANAAAQGQGILDADGDVWLQNLPTRVGLHLQAGEFVVLPPRRAARWLPAP